MLGSGKRPVNIALLALMLTGFVPGVLRSRVIAIVKTNTIMAYNEPIESFKAAVNEALGEVSFVEYDMNGDFDVKGMEIVNQLKAQKPDLVFTLGNKASVRIARDLPATPSVFAAVLQWDNPNYNLKTESMTGIAMEVPEEILLQQFKLVVPSLTTVGMLYNPAETGSIVQRAEEKAAEMGLSIKALEARSASELVGKLVSLIGQINGFWMQPDKTLYNEQKIFPEISKTCIDNRIPLLVASENFVKAGGLMSISWSYTNIGAQAGSIAVSILRDGLSPRDIPVASPIGTNFILNKCTADAIGVSIDDMVYSFADQVLNCGDQQN